MADVSPRPAGGGPPTDRGRADRGQLILVTGFALAVILLGLVLLLNAAIYTENVATRTTADDPREAIEIRQSAIETVEAFVEYENARLAATDGEFDEGRIAATVRNLTAQTGDRAARRGQQVTIDPDPRAGINVTTTPGETASDRFFTHNRSENGTADWTVLEDATETRAFRIELEEGEFAEGSYLNRSAADSELRVLLDDGETVRTIGIREDDEHLSVAVDGSDPVCSVALEDVDGTVTLDLTDGNGSIAGVPCEVQLWPGDPDEYAIDIENGGVAVGSFGLVTTGSWSDEATAATDTADAIYDVDLRIRYVTDSFVFETTSRVVPGDPP